MNTRASGLPLASPKSNPGVSKRRGRRRGNLSLQTPPGFDQVSPVKFEDITSSEGGGSDSESEVEEVICEDKPEQQPAMDPLDTPMHRRAAAVAVPPTRGSAITTPDLGDDFVVKGHHLKMIQDNTFDGRYNSDPHKHIAKFNELCEMFKYGQGKSDGVKLRLFPSSLTTPR